MRTSEKELYEQEAEIRPNHYVALALAILSLFIIGMLLVNEVGIFAVGKTQMRAACFAALIVLEIPQFAACTDAGLKNPRTKYLMVGCMGLALAIVCTFLNFHVTLALILPILLAAQYPNKKMSRIAMICSVLCAILCPEISYLIGGWDPNFLRWLYKISLNAAFETVQLEPITTQYALAKIFLYLSMPHALLLLAFYPLSSSIAKSGELRLKNQIKVLHMGESDGLTGLLNRLSFDQAITQEVTLKDGNVAVVYVDANDLHRINNEKGHNAGDRLLICVADHLRDAFGDESVYRTGGDEFVSVVYGQTLTEIQDKMKQVRAGVEENHYSIAYGIEYAQAPCTLPGLVESAETKMMIDKERYHISR